MERFDFARQQERTILTQFITSDIGTLWQRFRSRLWMTFEDPGYSWAAKVKKLTLHLH